jgi:hypothetical protein
MLSLKKSSLFDYSFSICTKKNLLGTMLAIYQDAVVNLRGGRQKEGNLQTPFGQRTYHHERFVIIILEIYFAFLYFNIYSYKDDCFCLSMWFDAIWTHSLFERPVVLHLHSFPPHQSHDDENIMKNVLDIFISE